MASWWSSTAGGKRHTVNSVPRALKRLYRLSISLSIVNLDTTSSSDAIPILYLKTNGRHVHFVLDHASFQIANNLVLTKRLPLRLGVFFTVRERQPSKTLFISTPVLCADVMFSPQLLQSQHLLYIHDPSTSNTSLMCVCVSCSALFRLLQLSLSLCTQQ